MRRLIPLVGLLLGVFGLSAPAHAAVCDLTAAGNTCLATVFADGTIWQQVPDQSTGTGVIDPFVRIQKNSEEEGYNTSGTLQFDEKAGIWTRDLLLSEVPVITIGAEQYLQFGLDINETSGGSDEFLSLDTLQIFLSATGSLSTYVDAGRTLTGATEVYDLDPGAATRAAAVDDTNNYVKLNYALNSGSGSGDMFLYVPAAAFSSYSGSTFVYLYSAFGNATAAGYDSSDGFEEWFLLKEQGSPCVGCEVVPEPGSFLLLGGGLMALGRKLRKRQR